MRSNFVLELKFNLNFRACLFRMLLTDVSLFEGRLAQPVEHLVYTERVGGSIPSPPTKGSLSSL